MTRKILIACAYHIDGHRVTPRFRLKGLAVTPLLQPGCAFSPTQFVVTHARSGYKFGDGRPLKDAIQLAKDAAKLCDWTRGRNQLENDIHRHRKWVKALVERIAHAE